MMIIEKIVAYNSYYVWVYASPSIYICLYMYRYMYIWFRTSDNYFVCVHYIFVYYIYICTHKRNEQLGCTHTSRNGYAHHEYVRIRRTVAAILLHISADSRLAEKSLNRGCALYTTHYTCIYIAQLHSSIAICVELSIQTEQSFGWVYSAINRIYAMLYDVGSKGTNIFQLTQINHCSQWNVPLVHTHRISQRESYSGVTVPLPSSKSSELSKIIAVRTLWSEHSQLNK